ncbi:MAG: sulfurtransferase TusA family protein [Promethearchaeota archaeon]
MNYDLELDAQGLVCPVPALKTKKQLGKMKPGQIKMKMKKFGKFILNVLNKKFD